MIHLRSEHTSDKSNNAVTIELLDSEESEGIVKLKLVQSY